MRRVLGIEVNRAVELLNSQGISCTLKQVSSRKGVEGDERRVVRVTKKSNNEAELTWACFKTGLGGEDMD